MTQEKHVGTITIRPPAVHRKAEERKRFLQMKDLAQDEFERNKKSKAGPRNFPALWIEMCEHRYANQLKDETDDAKRITEEAKSRREVANPFE